MSEKLFQVLIMAFLGVSIASVIILSSFIMVIDHGIPDNQIDIKSQLAHENIGDYSNKAISVDNQGIEEQNTDNDIMSNNDVKEYGESSNNNLNLNDRGTRSPDVTIEGFAHYYHWINWWDAEDWDPSVFPQEPIKFAVVKVLVIEDDGNVVTTREHTTFTDASGHFEYTVDMEVQMGADYEIQVKILAKTTGDSAALGMGGYKDACYVCLPNCVFDTPYELSSTFAWDGSVNVDFGTIISSDENTNGAFHIHEVICIANKWVRDNTHDGWSRPSIAVFYPDSLGRTCFLTTLDEICIAKEGDGYKFAWVDNTIQHEYGHAIMYTAYGNTMPPGAGDGPDPHTKTSESNEGFALVEGWAEFFDAAVDYDPFDTMDGYGNTLERNHWEKHEDSSHSTGNPDDDFDGNKVEGCVASVWWDIYDGDDCFDFNGGTSSDDIDVSGANDGWTSWRYNIDEGEFNDSYNQSFDTIFNILRNNKPPDIMDFFDRWVQHEAPQNEQRHWIKAIYYNHGMKTWLIETFPYFLDQLSITPEQNGYYSGELLLRVRPAEDDSVDRFWLNLKFRYSSDNGRTWTDFHKTEAVHDEYVSLLWDTTNPVFGVPDGEIIVQVVLDDDMNETYSQVVITIDNSPPVTSASFSGTIGDNDWYVSDVSIDLSATDEVSGVDTIFYRIDGDNWQTYSNAFSVSDDGLHTLECYSTDLAGNTEEIVLFEFKIDQTDPPIPVVSSPTHNEGEWTNNYSPTFNWIVPTDISGIAGYSYCIDQSKYTLPDRVIIDDETTVSYQKGNGIWYFHIRALDNAGNWGYPQSEDEWYYEIRIDTVDPEVPIISSPTHPEDIWTNDNDPYFTWNEPYDLNEISGYSYILDQNMFTTPDSSSNGPDTFISYIDVADGTWYFHLRALDLAGNPSGVDHYKIKIDTVKPISHANALPSYINSLNFDISFWVSEVGSECSGIQYVELWYRVDTGSGFGRWTRYEGTYLISPISFTAPFDGIYEFFTIATDIAGGMEDGPIVTRHNTDFQYFSGIGWSDLNNDDFLDLAAGGGCEYVHVYENYNGMVKNVPVWDRHLFSISDVEWCDINNDGYQDISIAGLQASVYWVRVYNNNGVISLSVSTEISNLDLIRDIAWGDFDRDGDLDLAIGTVAENKIFRNVGGMLESSPYWVSGDSVITSSVAWGDYDNDGDLDLAAGNDGNNVVYKNTGGQMFSPPYWISDLSTTTRSLAWGDINNDGLLDLVVANIGINNVYFNIGTGLETNPSWSSGDSGTPMCVALADINGDNLLDFIAGDEPTYVYFNTGSNFETIPSWNTVDPLSSCRVAIADMDNDGLQIVIDEQHLGNGVKHVFYLDHYPIHSIQEITVMGVPLSKSEYCVNYASGWISLNTPLSPGGMGMLVDYKYSNDLEVASAGSNWNRDIAYISVYDYFPRLSDTTTIVDTTPPEIPVISSPTHPSETTWYFDNDPEFEWTEPYDLNGIWGYSFILDDNPNTIPDTIWDSPTEEHQCHVEDGIWYFHVRAVDNAENWGGTDHYTIKIDTADPLEPTINSPTHPHDVWTSDGYQVIFDCYGPTGDMSGIAGYSYIFDEHPDTIPDEEGEEYASAYYYSVEDGIWYFHARAVDYAGNWGPTAHHTAKIDTEDPAIPTISSTTHPDENVWYDNNDPIFTWSIPPDLSGIDGYSCALDQDPNYILDSSVDIDIPTKSYIDVDDGIWYFYVRAIDNAGNVGSWDSYIVKIDTIVPPAPIISSPTHPEDVSISNDDPVFEWTIPDDVSGIAGYSYLLDQTANTLPDTDSEGLETLKSYNNIADGTWYFHVRALDNSGKWGLSDHYKIIIDASAPEIIVEANVALATETTATIEWTTDEPADSWIWWGTESETLGTEIDPNYVIEHSMTITELSLDQEYLFQVRSDDPTGNTVISDIYSFTLKKIDTIWYPDTSDPSYEFGGYTFAFPPEGGYDIFYVKVPKTATVLRASLWFTPDFSFPELPLDTTLDIGNDGAIELTISGEMGIGTNLISDKYSNPGIIQAIQDFVNDPGNQPDPDGLIHIPIKITSDSESGIGFTMHIIHNYHYVWATYTEPNPDPGSPYPTAVSVDIYYTGSGGIDIVYLTGSEYRVHSTIEDENWDKPAKVKSHYADINDDGIVDGTTIAEWTLQMYWWNEALQQWIPAEDEFGAGNTGVNAVENYVWADVDHFSNFTLKGSYVPIEETETLIETLDGMGIFPPIKHALRVKLEAALTYLNTAQNHFIRGELELGNENLTLAKNKLIDFIDQLEDIIGIWLTQEEADILINDAIEIIALIDEAYT